MFRRITIKISKKNTNYLTIIFLTTTVDIIHWPNAIICENVNYYLPMNFSGFKFALNLHAQRTLGYPSKEGVESGGSTDFLYMGLLINTPLKF